RDVAERPEVLRLAARGQHALLERRRLVAVHAEALRDVGDLDRGRVHSSSAKSPERLKKYPHASRSPISETTSAIVTIPATHTRLLANRMGSGDPIGFTKPYNARWKPARTSTIGFSRKNAS